LKLSPSIRSLLHYWKGLHWERSDWVTPLAMLCLCGIGVMFIYSSQVYHGGNLWLKQLIWIALGSLLFGFLSLVDYRVLLEKAHWIYLLGVALLLLVLTPLGTEIYNARRWIDLKVFSLQPSEIAKIATLILVCRILSRYQYQSLIESFTAFLLVMVVTAIPTFIIFLQPDLGSAMMIPIMSLFLLYVAGFPRKFFQVCFLVGLSLLTVVGWDLFRYDQFLKDNRLGALENQSGYETHSWLPLKDYQRNRLMAFVVPDRIDPQGLGVSWNVRQSLISVGTGGWSGKGWTQGTQAKLGYLPQTVAYNDFIFSVIAEESGFIGGTTVILLFAVLVFNGIRIARCANDRFGTLLAAGVSAFLFIHLFINIGMTLGIMPVTGLPLPFLSHGGTFLLSCFTLLAIHQSVFRHRERFT
jgi:rod shape determining protein RodA